MNECPQSLPNQRDQPIADPRRVFVVAFQPRPKCLFFNGNADAKQNDDYERERKTHHEPRRSGVPMKKKRPPKYMG